MYRLNIYENYPDGSFKLLESFSTFAEDREDAKRIALEYAIEKYPGKNVDVMNVN